MRPSSSRRDLIHAISEAAVASALYSASVEERATAFCFLVRQLIGFLPRKIIYAVVDLRSSRLPPQSASENPRSIG